MKVCQHIKAFTAALQEHLIGNVMFRQILLNPIILFLGQSALQLDILHTLVSHDAGVNDTVRPVPLSQGLIHSWVTASQSAQCPCRVPFVRLTTSGENA